MCWQRINIIHFNLYHNHTYSVSKANSNKPETIFNRLIIKQLNVWH